MDKTSLFDSMEQAEKAYERLERQYIQRNKAQAEDDRKWNELQGKLAAAEKELAEAKAEIERMTLPHAEGCPCCDEWSKCQKEVERLNKELEEANEDCVDLRMKNIRLRGGNKELHRLGTAMIASIKATGNLALGNEYEKELRNLLEGKP